MPEPQEKENVQKIVPFTFNDMIWLQLQEIGKRFDQVDKRIDQLDKRIDKLEEKVERNRQELNARMDRHEEKIDKLADKIDELRKDIQTSSNHGNIMTATVVGIALAVVYSILK